MSMESISIAEGLGKVTRATDALPEAPPGPRGLPFLGNALEARRDPLGMFVRHHHAFGGVVRLKFGPQNYYLVNDLDGVHHVLVENAANYQKSRNYRGLKLVLGQGLVTSEGDFWRRQRKLTQPAFHRTRLAGFARSMVRDTADMLDRWAARPITESFCVHEEMMRLTFRIVGRTLLSTDVDSDADEIGKAMNVALVYANEYVESIVPIPPFIPTPSNVRFGRAKKTLDRLVYRVIDDRRKNANDESDLLGMLMAIQDAETGEKMTDIQLRDEIMTMVLAGHETTANALSWLWMLLSKHPDVARRVEAEVDAVLGMRPPTLDDLPKLIYTECVIKEAMRLYPPVWIFERQAMADDVVGGYRVAAGTTIGISPWSIHRSTALWENPEGFDPDRFLPTAKPRPKLAYLPFGAGPRFCIGNAFAMMEAQIIVAMIAQQNRLALVPGQNIELHPVTTLRPKHGLHVTRHPRASPFAREQAALRALPEGRDCRTGSDSSI